MSSVLDQLKALMKSLGETDYSLQNKTHISQSTIYRILEGRTSDPGMHKIDGIARAMGHRLSLIPLSEENHGQQDQQQIVDIEILSKTITMVEGLAKAKGIELNSKQKAELILNQYQTYQKKYSNHKDKKGYNPLKAVNSK
ncbi:helix-turn-helix transcriptional regulator [Kangiella sp. TOML190]|uniref:helix-turn-helix domain-containing protein n=1 Tax=Kangiella sp. TOML190 TaxID=2931351 RepID=UPI002041236A|nr:helix-turn-helix transcriptional regulator [Kangiella sp. TOML190]